MSRRRSRPAGRFGAAFLGDRSGVAAVEFALIAPTLILVLVGLIDIGGMLYVRFQLDAAVNAGANFAMVNGTSANSTSGAGLASTLVGLVSSGATVNSASASVTVNDGPAATSTNGTVTTGGTASAADACYCPTGTASSSVTWGSTQTCGATCTGGGYAGKFVLLSASRSYTPIFSGYGMISQQGTITTSSLVQVQ